MHHFGYYVVYCCPNCPLCAEERRRANRFWLAWCGVLIVLILAAIWA